MVNEKHQKDFRREAARVTVCNFLWRLVVWVVGSFSGIEIPRILGLVIPVVAFLLLPIHRENCSKIHGIFTRRDPPEEDPIIELLLLGMSLVDSLLYGLMLLFSFFWLFDYPWYWFLFFILSILVVLAGPGIICYYFNPIALGLGRRLLTVLLHVWDTAYAYQLNLSLAPEINNTNPATFKYNHLDSERAYIRLVQITRSNPLSAPRYSLVAVELNFAPQYDAISYTWDDQDRNEHVVLDGKRLKTTRNVKEILAQRAPYYGTTWLWIDAVCINQDYNAEKTEQVKNMGKIYSSARRTLIWMDNNGVKPSDLIPILIIFTTCRLLKMYRSDKPIEITGYCYFLLNSYFWSRLQRFLNHPYWTRVWIIQEIARGQEVHIQYGGQMLNCFYVVESLNILANPPIEGVLRSLSTVRPDLAPEEDGTSGGISTILSLFGKAALRQLGPMKLAFALESSFESKCKIEQDKIYGLRSLVLDDEDTTSALAHLTNPDYDRPYPALFTEVTEYLLDRNPNYVFEKAGIGWEDLLGDRLPTWVVNLPKTGRQQSQVRSFRQQEINPESRDYRAGGDMKFSFQLLDRTSLRLAVIEVSVLSSLSNSWDLSRGGNNRPITKFFQSCNQLCHGSIPEVYQYTGQSRSEAFWRTIIGDKVRETPYTKYCFPAPADWAKTFLEWLRSSSPVTPYGNGKKLRDVLQDHQFGIQFQVACQGRRLSITEDEHMALVPDGARAGDVVCVVPGLKSPSLFRRMDFDRAEGMDSRPVQLVGSCYVHGIMNGESIGQELKALKEYVVY